MVVVGWGPKARATGGENQSQKRLARISRGRRADEKREGVIRPERQARRGCHGQCGKPAEQENKAPGKEAR